MLILDSNTEFGQHVAQRLREDIVIWLTTVRVDLTPQPSPVWFLWENDTFLIYSRPNTPKLRNIANSPTVALNFDGNGRGGDIIIFTGTAAIEPHAPPVDQVAAYVAKYTDHIKRIGMDNQTFGRTYSTAIRITPTHVRGF